MILIISILLGSGLLEVGLGLKWFWSKRRLLSSIIFVLVAAVSLAALFRADNFPWVYLLVYLSIYRLFNLYRIGYSRIYPDKLRHLSRLTSYRLVALQLIVTLFGGLMFLIVIRSLIKLEILASLDAIFALSLLLSTLRHKRITKKITLGTHLVDNNAPTLSVAIPARNETDSLNDCLLSLLAVDYPKLEILVLDDQSTTKRTSEVIRSFAQKGVIFIAGKPVEPGWLAKNWAYHQLLEASNGEIVLFCGADSRFSRDALRFLVPALMDRNKQMVSVIPKNVLINSISHRIIQPLRYAWQISLPRRKFQRPPLLSTCWLAKRNFLNKLGGFSAVRSSVICESYFAYQAVRKDSYSFFQYDGVTSDKKIGDQLETALRLRYPQLKNQPEWVALISMIELVGMIGPIGLLIYSVFVSSWLLASLGLLSFVVMSISFGLVVNLTYRRLLISSYFSLVLAIFIDLTILHKSMWNYEFGQVLWKGRSVNASLENIT